MLLFLPLAWIVITPSLPNIADEIIVIANGELADRGSREKILPMLLNDTESASAGCSVLRGEGK